MINKKYMRPYGEVEACSILLGYKTVNVGCCKVIKFKLITLHKMTLIINGR